MEGRIYNVCVIAPSISGGGGAERTAVLLCNSLCKDARFRVSIYTMDTKESAYPLDERVNYIKLDDGLSKNKLLRNIERIIRLRKVTTAEVDLAIGYTIQGGIFACICKLMNPKLKTIVCERQDPYQFSRTKRKLRDFLYRISSGAVFQTLDAQKYFNNIVKDSTVIPNFIDLSIMPDSISWNQRKNEIVSVGRLTNAKNHQLLINAFAEITNEFPLVKLKIYGEGPNEEELHRLIEKLDLTEKVELCGRKKDVFSYTKYAKYFVLSSDYEGYPNALLESMALGLSCISTDCPCGGPRAMIEDGKNGLLIHVNNSVELIEKLRFIISHEDIAEGMAQRAEKVRETNSSTNIMRQWITYIMRICEKET